MPHSTQHTAQHAARWTGRATSADGQGHRSMPDQKRGRVTQHTGRHARPLPTGRDTAAGRLGSADYRQERV